MITIGYSSRNHNQKHYEHLSNSVGLKNVEIIEIINNGNLSLSECYNEILKKSKFNINVYVHDDIKLEKNWGVKLLEDFNNNSDFGIIGKAGSCYFPKSGVYWERMHQTMVGQVWHHPSGQKKWINNYSPKLPFLIPVVTIDGLFISFDKTKIKHQFDETIGKFHFYDHGFSVPNYLDGIKIGVTSSFEITHESVGQPNQEFFVSKDKFVEKYGDKLPLDLKPSEVYVPNVKVKNVKINGKVAVIIPTKGKLDLLFQCIESFYDYCDVKLFDIFIADTGSSEEEIKVIEEFVGEVGNIKLIKYDYYNFAKINNDVVKNHIGKEYQYLLFCNNDIKLLSDVISGMLDVFKEKPKVGTVGCRLHYEDNTIQYDGIDLFFKLSQNKLLLDSINKNSYYNFGNNIETSLGNIGLMMINKNTFTQIGMFNESYTDLSDVELNLNFVIKGFNNYVLGTHPVYMFSTKIIDSLSDEFKNNLFPFIQKNSSKLKSQIKQIH